MLMLMFMGFCGQFMHTIHT